MTPERYRERLARFAELDAGHNAAVARCMTNMQVYTGGRWWGAIQMGNTTVRVVDPVAFDEGEG